jgi:hypothetical protein
MPAILELADGIRHVLDGPVRDIQRQRHAVWILIAKGNEPVDRLRRTLNIDRQSLLGIVSWRTIRQKMWLSKMYIRQSVFVGNAHRR